MSSIGARSVPLSEINTDILNSLEALPVSSATQVIQKTGAKTFANVELPVFIKTSAPVSSDSTWGTITGVLSAQSDLKNVLDTKQSTLVSGTNIKTINSTSIVGSGNITLSASISGTDTSIIFFDGDNKPAGDVSFTYNKGTSIATVGGLVTSDIHTVNANSGADITILTGSAVSGNTVGGVFTVTTGNGFGSSRGGDFTFNTGNGGATGCGGDFVVQTGHGGTTNGQGGGLQFTAGNGGREGGGGIVQFYAGNGGVIDGMGGNFEIAAGMGTGTGTGGQFVLKGGDGGSNGSGGDITVQAGGAGGGHNNGGSIWIMPGDKTGNGSIGTVRIQDASSTKVISFDTSVITEDQTFTFPDVSGTVALQGLEGTKEYYVSDTQEGPTDRKLTFVNGILVSES